ncbi:MAG TPA: sigma-54 dependent transcriptional regulator [Vicinamibacterales bacterium]|jgi:two-component system response regulator HydG|nr:sigma-54 dependent transcriptional regulator [Vicinamibacterales bacterium]
MSGQQPLLVVVDDEQGILDVVGRFARRAGFDVVTCAGGRDAIAQLQVRRADLVMVDLRMPDVGGLDVLRAIREIDPQCQAVLMTGYSSVETAVEAIKLGAMDYLSKPLDFARVQQLLATVRDDIERRRSVFSLETDVARRLEFCGMIGRGPVMQELFGMIRRLAPHVRTALITGETGTGKELVSRALHSTGPRRDRRFVAVNCSAVVEALFESELFGHVRGAFTGATENKPGLFEVADQGMLFLDEIGELPMTVQAKLLRVLELGEVHRVGSLEARKVNVHVVAATNRDLRAEVAAGRFRSDLYYRLNIVEVKLPPLRERREDIPYLTAAFVRETADRLKKPLIGLTPGAERILASAPWDGNVRELRNVLERACILADGEFVTERELAVSMPGVPLAVAAPSSGNGSPGGPLRATSDSDLLVTVEREHIQRALVRANGNKKAAARMLGLSRRALYRRLERLDLGETISRRRDNSPDGLGA